MTSGKSETEAQRRARLAKALRANLKRRKAQARDRKSEPDPNEQDSQNGTS